MLYYVDIVVFFQSRVICRHMWFFQSGLDVKIHVQVHFTIASQFYVRIKVEIYIHAFIHLCLVRVWFFTWWKKRRSSMELSNNISKRRGVPSRWVSAVNKRVAILSDTSVRSRQASYLCIRNIVYYLRHCSIRWANQIQKGAYSSRIK